MMPVFRMQVYPFWLLLLSVCGCIPQYDNSHSSDPKAITNRSTIVRDFKLVIVQLKEKPLFALRDTQGSEASKDALLKEQAAFLEQLQQRSPRSEVIYTYRFVLNGFYLKIPTEDLTVIENMQQIRFVSESAAMARPQVQTRDADASENDFASSGNVTSVSFIGADKVKEHLKVTGQDGIERQVRGQSVSVGVIDTGIDYYHKMFGGQGDVNEYKHDDHSLIEEGSFPTAKVVGGIDLVGSEYEAGAREIKNRVPRLDRDPIDESGHGTHVAGTIAGQKFADGHHAGVADGAKLHAIKVFGKKGSTSDAVVIAALEYAADPNKDLDPEDKLDVVNLSLGSSFGLPYILYEKALANLVEGGGVTAVLSAGNSGNTPYITGSPGTSEKGISVAASVDAMEHNWKFDAIRFFDELGFDKFVKSVEGSFTKPLKTYDSLQGRLIYIGLAAEDLSSEVAEALNGHIALIDRGKVAFSDKVRRAQKAGALGVVVVNHKKGSPIRMGGGEQSEIPGVMIDIDLGQVIKSLLSKEQPVFVDFKVRDKIEDPARIDTLTSFTSRGPRSVDSVIKPEVAAPGQQIISAAVGTGSEVNRKNGTSMAAPHIAGVVALIKDYQPDIDEKEIKRRLMATAQTLTDYSGESVYSVAYQGAGRVDAFAAVSSEISISPASLSLGQHQIEGQKRIRRKINLLNHSANEIQVHTDIVLGSGVNLTVYPEVATIAAGENQEFTVFIDLQPSQPGMSPERSAYLLFKDQKDSQLAKASILAVVSNLSHIKAKNLKVWSPSIESSPGALSEFDVEHLFGSSGVAYPFNLLAMDERKAGIGVKNRLSDICDLESVGFRILRGENEDEGRDILQIAAKLYSPITSWNLCEVSVQINGGLGEEADQELLGTDLRSLSDSYARGSFASVLTDAKIMRQLRLDYDEKKLDKQNYKSAIQLIRPMIHFPHSTLAIIQMPLDHLKRDPLGLIRLKVSSLNALNTIGTGDDFLGDQFENWHLIDPTKNQAGYYELPSVINLHAGQNNKIFATKGYGRHSLVVYLPQNQVSTSVLRADLQSVILHPRFL